MATWKKILVSGSSIEAASITGSAGLNLPFSNAGFILTTDANGNISETDPATITGADQSFSIRGDNDGGVNIFSPVAMCSLFYVVNKYIKIYKN